ncbi:hypothetical protein D3C81_826120 [compost metagenome]
MMVVVAERGVGRAGRMQQPERGHVARAEFDHALARLAVMPVQRIDLGLQRVDQAAQLQEQQGRAADGQAGGHEGRILLEAARRQAPQAQQGEADVGIARFGIGHQAQGFFQVGQFGLRGLGVQVRRAEIGLGVARRVVGLAAGGEVAAEWLEGRQGGVEGHRLQRRRQVAQVERLGQFIAAGRIVDFAVLEDQRQFQQAQAVVGQRIAVDLQLVHPPRIRVQCLDALVQALFVVLVLLLEMLGPQEQAFAP